MKRFKIQKVLMIVCFVTVAVLVFGLVVMNLWNHILVAVLGVKAVTFGQALGILLLCKILFGGFGRGGGFRGRRQEWKDKMEAKFGGMSQEEKDKFKAEWRNRCSMHGWGRQQQPTDSRKAAE